MNSIINPDLVCYIYALKQTCQHLQCRVAITSLPQRYVKHKEHGGKVTCFCSIGHSREKINKNALSDDRTDNYTCLLLAALISCFCNFILWTNRTQEGGTILCLKNTPHVLQDPNEISCLSFNAHDAGISRNDTWSIIVHNYVKSWMVSTFSEKHKEHERRGSGVRWCWLSLRSKFEKIGDHTYYRVLQKKRSKGVWMQVPGSTLQGADGQHMF